MTEGHRDPRSIATVAAFLEQEGLPLRVDELWIDPRQRLSALCYVRAGEKVLLIRRRKEPFRNHWTAPGGKVQPGESPMEAVVREVREETDLRLRSPELRLVATELGPDSYCWLLFSFVAHGWEGRLGTTPEGELAWQPIASLDRLRMAEVDRQMLPYMLEPPRGQVYLARIVFGPGGRVLENDITLVREGRPGRFPEERGRG